MNILTICTGDEFENSALSFAAHLNHYSPGQRVIVHVINPSNHYQQLSSLIKEKSKALNLKFHTSHSKEAVTSAESLSKYKLCLLSKYLIKYCRSTLYLDIHLKIRKDLLIYLNLLHHIDLAFDVSNFEAERALPQICWIRPKCLFNQFLSHLNFIPDLLSLSTRVKFMNLSGMAALNLITKPSTLNQKIQTITEDGIVANFISNKQVAVVVRRIDLTYKKGIFSNYKRAINNISTKTRIYWQFFPKLLRDAYLQAGYPVELISIPHKKINQASINELPHDWIYVPHKNHKQISNPKVLFYMQEVYPFLFGLDPQGWGATSSYYKSNAYEEISTTGLANEFINKVKTKKLSKFPQIPASLPDFDVFFPLQIPFDESLQFGSEYSYYQIVSSVAKWAIKAKVRVLFKCHPMNTWPTNLGIKASPPYVYLIKHGDIHQIFNKAKCVFVANSGVGFEALLYDIPVISFANSFYDLFTIKAKPEYNSIQAAYKDAFLQRKRSSLQLQWLEWYLYHFCINLHDKTISIKIHDSSSIKIENYYHKEIGAFSTEPSSVAKRSPFSFVLIPFSQIFIYLKDNYIKIKHALMPKL